jgi:hypothetical protein
VIGGLALSTPITLFVVPVLASSATRCTRERADVGGRGALRAQPWLALAVVGWRSGWCTSASSTPRRSSCASASARCSPPGPPLRRRFIPRLRGYRSAALPFSFRNVLKREYSGLFALVILFTAEVLEWGWVATGRWHADPVWLSAAAVSAVLYLTLRTLKRRTRLLHVDGR